MKNLKQQIYEQVYDQVYEHADVKPASVIVYYQVYEFVHNLVWEQVSKRVRDRVLIYEKS